MKELLTAEDFTTPIESLKADLEFIEFTGEKTHYFNGGMIACRCTVRM